jgi:hypothetical protein
MELEPKYIKAYNEKYEVDGFFIEKLKSFQVGKSLNIIDQIKSAVDELPKKEINSQYIAGVVRCEEPMFFEVEFLNEPDYVPIFIDIVEISCDEYLDHINKNQSL